MPSAWNELDEGWQSEAHSWPDGKPVVSGSDNSGVCVHPGHKLYGAGLLLKDQAHNLDVLLYPNVSSTLVVHFLPPPGKDSCVLLI